MAMYIEAQYSKKLGLPGFSSHQYSLTVRREVADLGQVGREGATLYSLLQDSVDREIRKAGFIGEAVASIEGAQEPVRAVQGWNCSEKQRDLILKLIEDHPQGERQAEDLSQDRFNLSLRELDKLQASGLIEELIRMQGPARSKRTGKGRGGYGR